MTARAAATRRSASRAATRALDVLERFGDLRRRDGGDHGVDQRVRGTMHDLERATGETITLAGPDDPFMLILDRIGPAAAIELPERGLRVSIFGSALGTA